MDIAAIGMLRALDLAGTCVFALSGAALAVRARMDLFGVLVLAIVTAVSGGIIRDLLVGAVPPAAISDWRPVAIAVLAGGACFLRPAALDRFRHPVQAFDAAGLGLFAATGAQAALDHGLNAPMAAVLGMVSAIGGGIVRDVLMARVPVVLVSEIYAVAALAGAATVVAASSLGVAQAVGTAAGALLCFFLRMMAIYRGWRLPVAARLGPAPPAGREGEAKDGKGRKED
jgi:uncharacterized membrane protein YeiH